MVALVTPMVLALSFGVNITLQIEKGYGTKG